MESVGDQGEVGEEEAVAAVEASEEREPVGSSTGFPVGGLGFEEGVGIGQDHQEGTQILQNPVPFPCLVSGYRDTVV